MNESKCCICGTTFDLEEMPSYFTPNTKTYCKSCLMLGYEDYEDLVNFGWEYGMFSNTYRQKIINPTLNKVGKTIKDFNEDVKKRLEEKDVTV